MIAIKISSVKNKKINKDLQKLTNNILVEKTKKEPNITNIENSQNLMTLKITQYKAQ